MVLTKETPAQKSLKFAVTKFNYQVCRGSHSINLLDELQLNLQNVELRVLISGKWLRELIEHTYFSLKIINPKNRDKNILEISG